MTKLIIYCPKTTPRLEYTLELVFQTLLPFDYQLTRDSAFFQQSPFAKINYSECRIDTRELFIPSGHLLFETNIRPQTIKIFETEKLKAFFPSNFEEADISFDLFAVIFYLVSRYEEYTNLQRDHHQRFPAQASLAFQHRFLHQPLANQWAMVLLKKLKQKFPKIDCQLPQYQFHPTYDVDLAWAYLHREWWRNIGSIVKTVVHGQLQVLKERLAVQVRWQEDPFDSFTYLDQLHQNYQLKPKFFFLLGDYGPFDKNIKHDNPALQELIKKLATQSECIGIHPSYRSNSEPERLKQEVQRLQYILQQPIIHSRQHFLKLQFPNTYRQLIKAGIQHDYTMGYASEIGFRASIATPFYWYDLENEESTTLMIHPFQVMDVTLKQYQKLDPDVALDHIQPMITACQKIGGQFCTLWHNSSFSNMEGWTLWKTIYEKLLAMASKKAIIS